MKYTRQDLLQIIPILRFGSSRPATTKFRWLTYTQIAALINCSVSHARQISIDFAKKYDEQKEVYQLKTRSRKIIGPVKAWRRSRLEWKHIEFLRSEETLKAWSGYSLKDRCRLFHRKFPEMKLSNYYIRQLYRETSIKKRIISKGKKLYTSQKNRIK